MFAWSWHKELKKIAQELERKKNNLKITSQSNLFKEKWENNTMLEKNQNKKTKKNNVFEKWKYKKENETFKKFWNGTKIGFFWKIQFDLNCQLVLEPYLGSVSNFF